LGHPVRRNVTPCNTRFRSSRNQRQLPRAATQIEQVRTRWTGRRRKNASTPRERSVPGARCGRAGRRSDGGTAHGPP
jgi:hypothetical protein